MWAGASRSAKDSAGACARKEGGRMFDPRLLAKLNLGRCFAFVGSGPSCEMGYPSWQVLASRTYEHLKSNGKVDDHESYERYLGTGSYPELFKIAEFDIGGRNALCRFLKQQLTPTSKAKGSIYELLVSWPFSCYLTTNYDNELVTQLESAGYHYAVRQNRMSAISAQDLILNCSR